MKVRFYFPRWEKLLEESEKLDQKLSGYDIGHFKMPGLAIPSVISAGPDDIEYDLVDEHMEQIDFDDLDYDLAAISFFTPQASRAYHIADEIRKRGKKVVMGGIHPTLMPEEAVLHADGVCAGTADEAWPRMIKDFKNGELQKLYDYRGVKPDFSNYPIPDRSIWTTKGYVQIGVVQISRGCTMGCPFCVLPAAAGKSINYKPVDRILEELSGINYPSYYIAEENIIFSRKEDLEYSRMLLPEMAKLKQTFFIASYPFIVNKTPDDILELMVAAGLNQVYLVIGLDPDSERIYDGYTESVVASIRKLQKFGIKIMVSMGVGGDNFKKEHFSWVVEFCYENNIDLAEFFIHTPFPQTALRNRLIREKRLLADVPWSRYNAAYPTYEPLHMTKEELHEGFIQLWINFYSQLSPAEVIKRLMQCFGRRLVKESDV